MPFGSFAAAVYLAVFSVWFALDGIGGPRSGAVGVVAVATSALLLVSGLRRRAGWARPLAIVAIIVFGWLALGRLLAGRDGLVVYLMLVGAPVFAVLLALPARGADRPPAARSRRWPAWAASIALVVALVAGWNARATSAASQRPGPGQIPASARTAAIEWHPLAAGIERARDEDRPLLVTVETSWCPYCRKMQTNTWSAPQVARRLADVVAVRVDAEDGASGAALAARYAVRGFPTQLLLAADGTLLARADGYQNARQFIAWLDGASDRAARGAR